MLCVLYTVFPAAGIPGDSIKTQCKGEKPSLMWKLGISQQEELLCFPFFPVVLLDVLSLNEVPVT